MLTEKCDFDMKNKFDEPLKELNTLTNMHAPIKRQSKREMKLKEKPWINDRILKMMRIRDRILQKLKKQLTPDNLKLYKKLRNRVTNE